MGRMAISLRASGLTWEHVSVVELSESDRPHVHFLQRGDEVSTTHLRHASEEQGVGWADIAPIRHLPTLARYVLKVPIGALDLEPDEAVRLLGQHKALNGGRLVSSTRGFWVKDDGQEVAGIRAARKEAYLRWKNESRRNRT